MVNYNRVEVDSEGKYVNKVLRDNFVGKFDHVKVYSDDVEWLADMTKSANIVLIYLFNNLEIGQDRVCIPQEAFNMSSSTFYDSINKLIELNIICKTDKRGWYFINPYKIFKGSRDKYISKMFGRRNGNWEKMKTIKMGQKDIIKGFEKNVGMGINGGDHGE